MNKFVSFVKDESGATAIEYGLIAAAMAAMLILAVPALASKISTMFGNIGDKMKV